MNMQCCRVAVAALLASAGYSCTPCNEVGCPGGIHWKAKVVDGAVLQPALYRADVMLEGTIYAVECTYDAGVGSNACRPPERLEGDGRFFLLFEFDLVDGVPAGFVLRAWESEGESIRGPRSLEISVRDEDSGMLIVDESYELEYSRDETFWGDRKCGFCDLEETRVVWLPTEDPAD